MRDNPLIVFVNFSFSNGCDLHDRRQKKKTKRLYFGLARHTFITNDGFEHLKMKHLALFNEKRQGSVFIPFGTVGFASRDRSDREYK